MDSSDCFLSAALVPMQVHYTFPSDLGQPIMQIEEARKAGSYHKTDPSIDSNSSLKEGQTMEQALQECQHQVRGGRWQIPSQLHFYMEMQSCVAQGDGEGGMEVTRLATVGMKDCMCTSGSEHEC